MPLGAPLLAANFPRAYIDVNREPWELDPRMFAEPVPSFANIRSARVAGGLGTVPKLVGEGLDIYSGRLPLAEALGRIEAVYKPYHEALKQLLARTQQRFGFAVLIDCHSMPASIRVGDSGVRPDFIIGDRFGASASAGAHRAGDRPAWSRWATRSPTTSPMPAASSPSTTAGPGRGLHALQIEVNRGLYMNERTFQKSSGFDALADDLARFIADLMAMPEYHFTGCRSPPNSANVQPHDSRG